MRAEAVAADVAAADAAAAAAAAGAAAAAVAAAEPAEQVIPASSTPAPAAGVAAATPARPPRQRPARGVRRAEPYLGCLRLAFAGRSDGVCYEAAVRSRYWRCASGYT
ncbi:hypothetical protein DL765_005977 [Monosporascus sp. GIB2]|nr:hypothetical protein DL765_005977 [Monosporascus sp. GIB2]